MKRPNIDTISWYFAFSGSQIADYQTVTAHDGILRFVDIACGLTNQPVAPNDSLNAWVVAWRGAPADATNQPVNTNVICAVACQITSQTVAGTNGFPLSKFARPDMFIPAGTPIGFRIAFVPSAAGLLNGWLTLGME